MGFPLLLDTVEKDPADIGEIATGHFEDSDWIDFVRGVISNERAAAIRDHLSRGCSSCCHSRDLWQRLNLAASDDFYDPPSDVLDTVKKLIVKQETHRK